MTVCAGRVEEQDAVIVRAREPKVQARLRIARGVQVRDQRWRLPTEGQAMQLAASRAVGHGDKQVVAEVGHGIAAWT